MKDKKSDLREDWPPPPANNFKINPILLLPFHQYDVIMINWRYVSHKFEFWNIVEKAKSYFFPHKVKPVYEASALLNKAHICG